MNHTPLESTPLITAADTRRVLLIHGAGHDKSVWSEVSGELTRLGLDPLALDLPGHGESAAEACRDIESMAQWLVDIVRASSDEPVVLAGHSMGSLIALEACALAPDLFSHLILVGSVFPMPVASALLEAARDQPESAYAMINKWSFAPGDNDRLRAQNLDMMRRQSSGVLHGDLAACNAYLNGFESARSIRCPICLISGSADKMTPVKAITPLRQALEYSQNEASLIVLENAGHSMMTEQAASLAKVMNDWIGSK